MRGLQPWLSPWADELMALYPQARVTSTFRTYTQQAMLYRRYLAGQSRFPAAPPGRSKHQYGRAFDALAPADVLRRMGEQWRAWGGRWFESDPIHFEA